MITRDAVFDLASLTKVIATTSMAMVLFERGVVSLDVPSQGYCLSSLR